MQLVRYPNLYQRGYCTAKRQLIILFLFYPMSAPILPTVFCDKQINLCQNCSVPSRASKLTVVSWKVLSTLAKKSSIAEFNSRIDLFIVKT